MRSPLWFWIVFGRYLGADNFIRQNPGADISAGIHVL